MTLRAFLHQFASDTRAGLAIVAALSLSALIVLVGLAVDYASLIRQRAELQAAADAAAIAGAKEIPLALSDSAQIEVVASNYARANLGLATAKPQTQDDDDDGSTSSMRMASSSMMMAASSDEAISDDGGSGGSTGGGSSVDIKASVIDTDNAVLVNISKPWKPFFAGLLPTGISAINVTARAQIMGMGKICVLGLMESSLFAGIHLDNNSSLSAPDCGVHSNSTSSASIRADSDSSIEADMICTSGGYRAQSGSSFTPDPTTDCPSIPDPLADRPAPPTGSCTAMGLVIETDTTLDPGTYCDGLSISGNSNVTLNPGVYVIKDGPLIVSGTASLTGQYVGFYLTGGGSLFNFMAQTSIDLVAPRDGPLAGLLFMEDSSAPGMRMHQIRSNNARQLLGTIYLPKSILQVDANAPVADQSAYTAIVVMRLWLKEGPTLVLNSDYSATDVPVPSAIAGGRVILTE